VKWNCPVQQQKEIVKDMADIWSGTANIRFNFIDNGLARIRISFSDDLNSWSKIGTACLGVHDQIVPTMNLGCFKDGMSMEEIRGTILHEFGHVLGCIHEHQHPNAAIPWDKRAIIRAFLTIPGWDEDKIRQNILNSFPQQSISNSDYDPSSIMHYYLPDYFTNPPRIFTMNNELSQQDKDFIGCCYPF